MEHRATSRRAIALILIGIIVVTASTRLYGLDRQSVWYDEVYEEKVSKLLFSNDRPFDTSRLYLLHSLFIHPMTKIFPGSDFALRIPTFVFGLISVPLLFFLGRRLFNEKVGLLASFLLAISPFHIWHSQDARMYALQWMLALISMLFFLRTLEQPNRGNYIGYLISTTAGLYTHHLTVFLLLLQGLYILIFLRKYKEQFFKWVGLFITVIILYLPLIIINLTILINKSFGFPKETDLKAILYTIFTYCVGFSIGPSSRELHIDQSLAVVKPYLAEIVPIMLAYGMLFMLGLWSVRKDRSQLLFLLLLFIVPIIGIFTLSKLQPTIQYSVRHTGIAFFAFLLFIAKGVDWLTTLKSKTLGRILAVLAIVTMTGFSTYSYANYQFDKRYHKPDIRSAVAYIKDKRMADDIVLCIVNSGVFNRYSRDNDFRCWGLSSNEINDQEKIEAKMQKVVKGKGRLWLVLSREWYADKNGYANAWLDANYEEIKQLHRGVTEIANVRIYYYDLTKKKTVQNGQ